MASGHPRFEDVWTWDQPPQKIPYDPRPEAEPPFLIESPDMSDTSDPWMVIYDDTAGGLSACTFVKESSVQPKVFAFYNEAIEALPVDDLSFKEIWTNLSTVVSPTYESMEDIQNIIGVTRYTDRMIKHLSPRYPMYFLKAQRAKPQSINKYTIV